MATRGREGYFDTVQRDCGAGALCPGASCSRGTCWPVQYAGLFTFAFQHHNREPIRALHALNGECVTRDVGPGLLEPLGLGAAFAWFNTAFRTGTRHRDRGGTGQSSQRVPHCTGNLPDCGRWNCQSNRDC